MPILRSFYLLCCLSCFLLVAMHARWEASFRTNPASCYWQLPSRPLWSPPVTPSVEEFSNKFNILPSQWYAGETPQLCLKWDWMLCDLLLYLWPVHIVCGFFYWLCGEGRPDLILQTAFAVSISFTLCVASCLALYVAVGGWGPPVPLFFGSIGILGGLLYQLANYTSLPQQRVARVAGTLRISLSRHLQERILFLLQIASSLRVIPF